MSNRKMKISGSRRHERKCHDRLMDDMPICQSNEGSKLSPRALLQMKKITDLESNCLVCIFKHLSIRDLLNVFDSSKRLRECVKQTFINEYNEKPVFLCSIRPNRNRKMEIDCDGQISIDDFKTSLQFLRCLGDLITDLKVNFRRPTTIQCNKISRYIIEYCSETLVNFDMHSAWEDCFDPFFELQKRFSKVESVTFRHSNFKREMNINLNIWFPQLKSLNFQESIEIYGSKCKTIENHFPYLEKITIDARNYSLWHPVNK